MSDHIELRSMNDSGCNENGGDTEYHEIRNYGLLGETKLSPETPTKPPDEFNFFTQFDVKSFQKVSKKKKKGRKKDPVNLMDVIASKLLSVQSPLTENVITKIDYSKEQASYLEKTPRFPKIFTKDRTWRGDAEKGWRHKGNNLNPIFPRVLENALAKDKNIPVQYVEPIMFDDIVTEYQEYEVRQPPKFLEISIKDITFLYHHDFSIEKLLCISLLDRYKEYCSIQREIRDTLKNIEISKKTRDNLKQQLVNIGSSTKDDLRFDETVLNYTGKFFHFKDKYYQLLSIERELKHKVISLWDDIEMIRQVSGATNTEYVVEISKSILDDDTYENEMVKFYEIEFSDMLDRLEYEYVIKYLEYKKFKQNCDTGDSKRKKILKPKLHIDQDKIKDNVENIVNKIVTKEKINIFLKEDKNVLKRLSTYEMSIHKYDFKIYVDNVFVCESENMTSPFLFNRIDFIDALSIQILPNNETLAIFLCEDGVKVASVVINVPEVRINSLRANFHTHFFTYSTSIEPTFQNIGSGYEIKEIVSKCKLRLKSSNMFKGKLHTTAKVNIKTGWSDRLNESQCDSVQDIMHLGRQLKRLLHGIDKPNVRILTDIIEKIYDTNINNDSNIKTALEDASKDSIHDNSLLKIDVNRPEMVRLRLLHLRSYGGLDCLVDKSIPIFPSQISTEQLTCLQKSEAKSNELQFLDGNTDVNPIDMQRFMSFKYIEKLNVKLQKSVNEHLLKKTYKDVVRDFKDLNLRGIFSNQSNFELEATSSIAKQRLLKECISKEQEISVDVVRAFNLLDRTAIISEEQEDRDSIAGFKVRPLRPFVRVRYHGVSAQTSTAIGCYPTWNGTVKIKSKLSPLSSIHVDLYDECKVDISEAYSDDEPSSLTRTVHYRYYNKWLGTVQIPLFTVLTLGSLRGTFKVTAPPLIFGYDTVESKESKSVIPDVIQLMTKKLSFLTLHISTNLCHLGGFQGYTQPVPNSEDDVIIRHLNTFVTDYINEFPSRNICLAFIDTFGRNKCINQFLQPIPLPDFEWFPKYLKMTDSALSKSSGHSRSSSSKSSKRRLSITKYGEDKESEINAPECNWKGPETKEDNLLKLVDAAVRYVALIPTYEILESHVATLSGAELLKVVYGSPLDHTLLLAGFFLHLGIRCWVVSGLALPRGLTSYVLVKYDQRNRLVIISDSQKTRGFFDRDDSKQFTWFLYDAVIGERFELRDASCPLKTVSFVFDTENIWVNTQTSQDCENVSFDFSKSSDWQPVFEDPLYMIKQPAVSIEGLYSTPPDVEQLRSALEVKLKGKVQKWRAQTKTIWNRYCGSLLREMLPRWEYWAFNPSEPRPVPGQRLKQLMVTYKMFGFPLNVPYTNAKSVTSNVKSTGIHLNDDPDVEFALAVDIYAYRNNVLSVWVFLASITKI